MTLTFLGVQCAARASVSYLQKFGDFNARLLVVAFASEVAGFALVSALRSEAALLACAITAGLGFGIIWTVCEHIGPHSNPHPVQPAPAPSRAKRRR